MLNKESNVRTVSRDARALISEPIEERIWQQIWLIEKGEFRGQLSIIGIAKAANVTPKTIYNRPDELNKIRDLLKLREQV